AKNADLHEYILNLPQGYDTKIGEDGVKLSVGQKQRISIARATLTDPRILILDDATSALDSKTEANVQAGLERLMKGRTSFVITHRLSAVVN
ncbi:ATP-binding cassette domain-containing protein, partial [Klebsiella pneumoniae]|uniref:ATP-binding cassette domain-containing protein n=1 Tax=Klebsiella pneumoniae TaxID=573 RepID=UPI003013A480